MRYYIFIVLAIATSLVLSACSGGGRGVQREYSSDRGASFFHAGGESAPSEAPRVPEDQDVENSDAVREELRSLGYIQGDDARSDAEPAEELEEVEEDIDATEVSVVPTEDEFSPDTGSDTTAGGLVQLAPAIGGLADESAASDLEMIPEGWPYYIPIMEGFIVRYGASDENGLRVGATGDSGIDAVKEFYQGLSDWNVATERDRSGNETRNNVGEWLSSIFVITRGDESLTVNVFQLDGKTSIDLLYDRIQ